MVTYPNLSIGKTWSILFILPQSTVLRTTLCSFMVQHYCNCWP